MSSPGYTSVVRPKYTKSELDDIQEPDLYLIFEETFRAGIPVPGCKSA